jgi:UDP-N-acetylmuramoyl-L-alanyl-D-glutamate--2,6-diaminopimelate ligase
MWQTFKNLLRPLIPKFIFRALQPLYHGTAARIAATRFKHPSQKLTVIGVTGTAGKSTTVIMLARILNHTGLKTGFLTTVSYFDGDREHINEHGMSMPGGWLLQKSLADMIKKGCRYAVIECTSEGLAQNRHAGITFSGALFTNLSPAHIDTHGSFENYKRAKGRLFAAVGASRKPTIVGANIDDPNRNYFLSFPASRKFGITTQHSPPPTEVATVYSADDINVSDHMKFKVKGVEFALHSFGTFNISNALLAIGYAHSLGIALEESAVALRGFGHVAGRMEQIPNARHISIIVDYAPEPAAMEQSLLTAQKLPHQKIIHVFGSTGGHRDVSKRFTFGSISARHADTIIITNDDVYDSDPEEIARNIQEGILQAGTLASVKRTEVVLERRAAIARALEIAEPGDLILITGKGSEQFLVLPGNKRVPWDDRAAVRQALEKLS